MLASERDFSSLKTKVDNLGNNMVDNDVAKKTGYKKLVNKANVVDTQKADISGLVTKTQYDSEKLGLETNTPVG